LCFPAWPGGLAAQFAWRRQIGEGVSGAGRIGYQSTMA
jgi:hypothetical protein